MLVVCSGTLVTIVVGVGATIVSVAATWWFAKRRFYSDQRPPTENDIELAKTRNEWWVNVLGFAAVTVLLLGALSLPVLMILLVR